MNTFALFMPLLIVSTEQSAAANKRPDTQGLKFRDDLGLPLPTTVENQDAIVDLVYKTCTSINILGAGKLGCCEGDGRMVCFDPKDGLSVGFDAGTFCTKCS